MHTHAHLFQVIVKFLKTAVTKILKVNLLFPKSKYNICLSPGAYYNRVALKLRRK